MPRLPSLLLLAALAAAPGCSKPGPSPTPTPPAPAPKPTVAPPAAPPALQVRETTAGSGEPLRRGDHAKVRYLARTGDGRVFEDRSAQEPPVQMVVGPQMPPWWEEGLQAMRPGGHYRVEVPIERMGPAARRPAALQGSAVVTYDVQVVGAIRMPRFSPLDPGKSRDEAGFPTEVLAAGTGEPPAATHWCTFHFVAFGENGGVVDSTYAVEKPMRAPAAATGVPFLSAILPRMRPGATFRCTSPATAGHSRWPAILGATHTITWQVELLAVTPPLPLPAFTPPAAETMLASASGVRVLVDGGQPELVPPADGKRVEVHFACWLADGTLVDSSFASGLPSELALAPLPGGLREGFNRLPLGKAGWLRIPAAQGYGDAGLPARRVPPGAELIVRAELLRRGL